MFKYISSKIMSKINEYKLIKENINKIKENNVKMQKTIDNICNIKLEFTEVSDSQRKEIRECSDFLDVLENNIEYMEPLRLERILYILNSFMTKYEKSNISKTFEVQKCVFKVKKLKNNIESKLYTENKQLKKII